MLNSTDVAQAQSEVADGLGTMAADGLAACPSDGPPEPRPTPLDRARTLCELGRFADAVSAVAAVITQEPRNPEAWCLMSEAQLGNERPVAALEAARAAASLKADAEQPHRLASVALTQLDREREAAEAARLATASDPGSWQAHAQLAHCLAAFRSRLGEARRAAQRAQALSPDEPGAHMAAGAVALAAGRRSDAAAAFCAALAADPQCGEAHNQLANLQAPRRGPRRWLAALVPGRGRSAQAG